MAVERFRLAIWTLARKEEIEEVSVEARARATADLEKVWEL
jgi:hypothetical protein